MTQGRSALCTRLLAAGQADRGTEVRPLRLVACATRGSRRLEADRSRDWLTRYAVVSASDAAEQADRRDRAREVQRERGEAAEHLGGYESEELQLGWAALDYCDMLAEMAVEAGIPRDDWWQLGSERGRQLVRDVIASSSAYRPHADLE